MLPESAGGRPRPSAIQQLFSLSPPLPGLKQLAIVALVGGAAYAAAIARKPSDESVLPLAASMCVLTHRLPAAFGA